MNVILTVLCLQNSKTAQKPLDVVRISSPIEHGSALFETPKLICIKKSSHLRFFSLKFSSVHKFFAQKKCNQTENSQKLFKKENTDNN